MTEDIIENSLTTTTDPSTISSDNDQTIQQDSSITTSDNDRVIQRDSSTTSSDADVSATETITESVDALRDMPDPFNIYNIHDEATLDKYYIRLYTPLEEKLNYLTHAAGAILAIIGMFFLLAKSGKDPARIVSSILFSITMFVTFFVSAVYHSTTDIRKRSILRSVDHSTISMMIVGMFIPMVMLSPFNLVNYLTIGVAVGIAIYIALLCLADLRKFKTLTFVLQFLVGFMGGVIFILNYNNLLPVTRILYFVGGFVAVGGGLSYLIKTKYIHCVFHVIVMIGAAIFYAATYTQY